MTQYLEPTELEIQALLEPLVNIGARDAAAAKRGRELFLGEVDRMAPADALTSLRKSGMWFGQFSAQGGFSRLWQITPLRAMVVLAVVITFLFGGAWATASAAENALPGDLIYSIKTMVEETRIALSRDAAQDVELHVRFAEERLNEINALIEAERFDDIEAASDQAEFHIQEAISNLALVSPDDPALVQRLSERIAATLVHYYQVLTSLLTLAPREIQQEIQESLDFSGQFDVGQDPEPSNSNNNPGTVGGVADGNDNGDNSNDNRREIGDDDRENGNRNDGNENNDDGNDDGDENGEGDNENNDDGNENGDDDIEDADDRNENTDDNNENGGEGDEDDDS